MIEIKINGRKKKELFAIIRRELDHINKSIKKVKITKEIPCSCSISCPHRFDYKQLLNAEERGKPTVDCPESWNEVPVSLLLDGYERKEDRMKEIDEILKYNVININYQNVEQHNTQEQESNQSVKIDIDVKIETFRVIQSDFETLEDLLIELNPKFKKELDKIGGSLDKVSAHSDEKLVEPLTKVGLFLEKLGDENSEYCRMISGSKKGIKMAQKLGKNYNKFAQWIPTLPVVPDLFLGK